MSRDEDLPEDQQFFRYWIEIRVLADGSARTLPLSATRMIHLPTRKSRSQLPDEQLLQLQDGSEILEAKSFDELVAQLRERYPDAACERFLRSERDHQAEQKHRNALDSLARIYAKAAVDEFLRSEQSDTKSIE